MDSASSPCQTERSSSATYASPQGLRDELAETDQQAPRA
jgi:hypothetical protein